MAVNNIFAVGNIFVGKSHKQCLFIAIIVTVVAPFAFLLFLCVFVDCLSL